MTPLRIGVTGGIACGKSALGKMLEARGWKVLDTDRIAHELLEPGAENWQKVVDLFGPTHLNADQTINRLTLGKLVFRDPNLRKRLNEATHPAIRQCWQEQRRSYFQSQPDGRLAILVPLLFEVNLEPEFDEIWCVAASPALQRQRLQERGLPPEEAMRRMESQLPMEEKIRRSHRVFWNNGTLANLSVQLRHLPLTANIPT